MQSLTRGRLKPGPACAPLTLAATSLKRPGAG